MFTLGGFLREAETADREYDRHHTGTHTFHVQPYEELVAQLTAENSFFAQVYLTRDDDDGEDAHEIPGVGHDVVIKSNLDLFKGTVVATEGTRITMDLHRIHGVGPLVLTTRIGHFTFDNPRAPYVSVTKGVQRALYMLRRNWLKPILLGHENHTVRMSPLTGHPPQWLEQFPQLNAQQLNAFRQAGKPDDKLVMMQGPPGTGKTRVIGMVAVACIKQNIPFMISAETHYAVKVCADRIRQDCEHANIDMSAVFHISREILDVSTQVATNPNHTQGGQKSTFAI